MANLNGHAAGNGGHGQGEPTGTAPVLDPTFREGDGNVGIIRRPVRAITLPDLTTAQNLGGTPRLDKIPDRYSCAPPWGTLK